MVEFVKFRGRRFRGPKPILSIRGSYSQKLRMCNLRTTTIAPTIRSPSDPNNERALSSCGANDIDLSCSCKKRFVFVCTRKCFNSINDHFIKELLVFQRF